MDCLRCGKKAEGDQFFCGECLEVMKQSPVKPGTPVHIPHRPVVPPEKKPPVHKREPVTMETIQQYRKIIRWLTVTVAILCLVLCLMVVLALLTLDGNFLSDILNGNDAGSGVSR